MQPGKSSIPRKQGPVLPTLSLSPLLQLNFLQVCPASESHWLSSTGGSLGWQRAFPLCSLWAPHPLNHGHDMSSGSTQSSALTADVETLFRA